MQCVARVECDDHRAPAVAGHLERQNLAEQPGERLHVLVRHAAQVADQALLALHVSAGQFRGAKDRVL
jgi:hypothetical protein